MFYIPGLIYTLSNITTTTPNVPGTLACDSNGNCIDMDTLEKEVDKETFRTPA
jgi:hypothetical protein